MHSPVLTRRLLVLIAAVTLAVVSGLRAAAADQTLNALFIGNSYTGRHNLSQVVKAMAEAGNPGLRFEVTTVIYGGRTLKDHWRLGTQNFVKVAALKRDDVRATLATLEQTLKDNPKDNFATAAIARQKQLLASLDQPQKKWDVVVLQSYRDDIQGEASTYLEYAPKFAALIKAQGGRVILYETTSDTQNAQALTAKPDPAPVIAKARLIAALAKRIDASVVPMSMVGLHSQTVRPDLTLRFINDGHLNHAMAYLTACTFQAALFGRLPEGLPVDKITDIRFLDNENKDKDRDGQPLTRVYSAQERAELQRIAWAGYRQYLDLAKSQP
jgi:hypothetical protein